MNKRKPVLSYLFLSALFLYLLTPLIVTLIYSLFQDWTGIIPRRYTLESYSVIFHDLNFWMSMGRTIGICVIPIVLTIIMVLLTLFVTAVYFPELEKYVQLLCMIPYTIQGVILSVSILSLYVGNPSFMGNRFVMLMGAYCVIILPHVYTGIRNGMRTIHMHVLLEAAETLGASKLYAFIHIIVPNIISSVLVSALLAVGILFGDYVIDRNLAGSLLPNIQIYMYQAMKADPGKASCIFCVIMLVTFLIAAVTIMAQSILNHKETERAK